MFKRELIVGTQTVTVTEGATVSSNIHDTFALEVGISLPTLTLEATLMYRFSDDDPNLANRRL